ncbi:MAG: thioredoxin domain-containing protein [Actinomycetota bacterium]|jgi:uncharacterized protein YyaL (SSP411 family)|nr:thioredoxin domain-containing protein [Actinomycetota bacterium]
MNGKKSLYGQTSPYLAMHIDDPVDWMPWGHEAFDRARAEDRPVLLSVGYASCHWCHVMHRESFRDEATAGFLNEHFISVKVDREERPDIDSLYMDYVAAATGGGGWPMTVILTPEGLPLFGGTYFPRQAPTGSPSFMDVLRSIDRSWRDDREEALRTADTALDFLQRRTDPPPPREIDESILESAVDRLLTAEDRDRGGFGTAPKFPQTSIVTFLLRFAQEAGDDNAERAAKAALTAMVRGGIYDQVEGGMSRYATDAEWLVPHFEKMLYDNALLLSTLAVAHEFDPDQEFAHVMRQTARFLDTRMSDPDGGYIASLSADTAGVEGATYVWTHPELESILSTDEMVLAREYLGVSVPGNWNSTIILTRRQGRESLAKAVDKLLERLRQARGSRPQPDRDTKVIVSWNAMTASGLMDAGHALGDDALLQKGRDLVAFLYENAVVNSGVLHILDDPAVKHVRLIEDSALLTAALLTAYDYFGDTVALERAEALHEAAVEQFVYEGVAFMTDDATDLPVRPREQHDNPTPSGATTLASNALRLYAHTLDETHHETARRILEHSTALAEFAPSFVGSALEAMLVLLTEE